MKTHKTKRIYQVRCKSGLMGWRTRLQNNYTAHHEWYHSAQTFGLHKRLGYKTPTQAWRDNPVIEGSVNPSDFRKVKA